MYKFITIMLFFITLPTPAVFAQNKTAESIENAGEVVEKTNETVDKAGKLINSIFGKKKKNNEEKGTETNTPSSNSEVDQPSKTIEHKTVIPKSSNLKAGSIHPDAVVLDVDKLYPFYGGAAIVQKGVSSALINAKGEFIVPFNKYNFILKQGDPFRGHSGIFKVISEQGESGLVNAKGQFFKIPDEYKLFRVGGEYLKLDTKRKTDRTVVSFMDFNGKLYTMTELPKYEGTDLSAISEEGLFPYQNSSTYKWGYKNINNKTVISAKYDEAYPFSNETAIVGKKNEFGEMKYGYTTTDGSLLIPLKFSNKPELFSNGLALVYYNEGNKQCAIINKKGEIIYSGNKIIQGPFNNGYAAAGDNVLDTNGKLISVKQFLMNHGVPEEIISHSTSVQLPHTFEILYANRFLRNNTTKIPFQFAVDNMSGFVDVATGKSFYGNFYLHNVNSYFDSTAKRALVEYKDSSKTFEGYINEDGVFMIVKGEASKW